MGELNLKKRSQADRLIIADALVDSVWEEIRNGKSENVLQLAADIQVNVNRIVWKLNEIQNKRIQNGQDKT